MNLQEKIERSKNKELIDFSKIGCTQQDEPMVRVEPSDLIIVEPIWTVDGDFEGAIYAGYIAEHPDYSGIWVRAGLHDRLLKAAELLNGVDGKYKLVVRAGHRPLKVQKQVLKEAVEAYMAEHPDVSQEEALDYARIFVNDPDIQLPSHCCGGAIDVDLFDTTTNKFVDFGSPVNYNEDISYLHSELASPAAKANRMMLLTAMLDAGFASDISEWWHYSYGDQTWAWFYGYQNSLYAPIDI
jgi:D-alanyl-D-alanine dipeptidase